MNFLTSWLLSIIATAFFVSIAEALMPDKKVQEVGRVVGGILILLSLLTPLFSIRLDDWEISVEDYFSQIDEKKTLYEDEQTDALASLIKEESEAYIETVAQESGLTVQANVEISKETEDGVPNLIAVQLDIPYNQTLSECIERELGIDAADQKWSIGETG